MSILINDHQTVDHLITSDLQDDDEILQGLNEANSSGQSTRGFLIFSKFPLTGDISMGKKTDKVRIIFSKNIVSYLMNSIEIRKNWS